MFKSDGPDAIIVARIAPSSTAGYRSVVAMLAWPRSSVQREDCASHGQHQLMAAPPPDADSTPIAPEKPALLTRGAAASAR